MTHHNEFAPAAVGAATGAENPPTSKTGDSFNMMPPTECRFCTVPIESGDVCSFCKFYVPPLDASDLLTEADQALDLAALLAARIVHASSCFPIGDSQWYAYSSVEGNRIAVAASHRDPQTRQLINREFVAELREMTR